MGEVGEVTERAEEGEGEVAAVGEATERAGGPLEETPFDDPFSGAAVAGLVGEAAGPNPVDPASSILLCLLVGVFAIIFAISSVGGASVLTPFTVGRGGGSFFCRGRLLVEYVSIPLRR